MFRRSAIIAASAMLSAAGLSVTHAAEETAPVAEAKPVAAVAVAAPSLPAGIKSKDPQSDNKAIRETFEDLAEAALMDNDFDDLVERLVDQDRNRIGRFAEGKFDDLNQVGQQIRDAWKAKYDGNFEFDSDVDFKQVAITRGEIDDAKTVATSWPVPAVIAPPADAGAVQAAASKSKTSNANPDLNSNLENGREVAIATIPASHGLPALSLSLVKEAGGYRVDVPNTTDGQQLHDNLLKHLKRVLDEKDGWPADKRDANTMILHHVAMAIYDVDAPAARRAAND